jgi:hypothetical protein
MFSNCGERQFAPHRTKAEEDFVEILLHLMGKEKPYFQTFYAIINRN